jgi:lipoprotein-anchoring transpeptidase ErfK/SrfK
MQAPIWGHRVSPGGRNQPALQRVCHRPRTNDAAVTKLAPITLACLLACAPAAIAAEGLTAATVNDARFAPRAESRKAPNPTLLRVQILLDRAGFSPGEIDGKWGANARAALTAFETAQGLRADGKLDKDTFARLTETASEPAIVEYKITKDDIKGPFAAKAPDDYEEMAKLDRLAYTSPLELLAEKFHASPDLLRALNPGQAFDTADATILVPNSHTAQPDRKVARIEVDKRAKAVRALGPDGALVAYYPASVGSREKPAPSGTYKVRRINFNPTYTYDPRFGFKGVKAKSKLEIAEGPNNPVGTVWIDLTKPTYGIHGTGHPEAIGKVESHGCVRLTNWDADELARMVRRGTEVAFLD